MPPLQLPVPESKTPPRSDPYDKDPDDCQPTDEAIDLTRTQSHPVDIRTFLRQTARRRQERSETLSVNSIPAQDQEDQEESSEGQIYLAHARAYARHAISLRAPSPPVTPRPTRYRVKLPPLEGEMKEFGPAMRVKQSWEHLLTKPAGVQASSPHKWPNMGTRTGENAPWTMRRKSRGAVSEQSLLPTLQPDPNSQLTLETGTAPATCTPADRQADPNSQLTSELQGPRPVPMRRLVEARETKEDMDILRVGANPNSQLTLEIRGPRPTQGQRRDGARETRDDDSATKTDENTNKYRQRRRRSVAEQSNEVGPKESPYVSVDEVVRDGNPIDEVDDLY